MIFMIGIVPFPKVSVKIKETFSKRAWLPLVHLPSVKCIANALLLTEVKRHWSSKKQDISFGFRIKENNLEKKPTEGALGYWVDPVGRKNAQRAFP